MRRIAVVLFLITIAVVIALTSRHPEQGVAIQPEYIDGTIMIAGRGISFELAATEEEQRLGLSKRSSIEENQAMLFTFPRADFPIFWMKDMRFPIDMVWLKGNEVVDIIENVEPQPGVSDKNLRTYSPDKPADKVLELKGGWASRNGLKIGDLVEITQVVR